MILFLSLSFCLYPRLQSPSSEFPVTNSLISFAANCVVMALDEHLPNGDKTLLALQLVSPRAIQFEAANKQMEEGEMDGERENGPFLRWWLPLRISGILVVFETTALYLNSEHLGSVGAIVSRL